MIAGSGNPGCPCVNATAVLAAVAERQERRCVAPGGGSTGVLLTLGGNCVPLDYGSSQCLRHDRLDSACRFDNASDAVPPYCVRPWCYVDRGACGRESRERAYRSSYFDRDSGVELFYSYSTCNSTADDWFDVASDMIGSPGPLGGVSIRANIPTYDVPWMFKRDPISKDILYLLGNEYYDDEVPFEGVMIDYMERILEVSGGDIANVTYTHRSKASGEVHPYSNFTAAVQDVSDGLVDMSIGPFWITVERLQMVAFSVPLYYEQLFLVIKNPGTTRNQATQILEPFTPRLWIFICASVCVAALFSLWVNDRHLENDGQGGSQRQISNRPPSTTIGSFHRGGRQTIAYMRLVIHSCLQASSFFCNASVDFDEGSSLSNKCLMIGFACIILTSVAAYVANFTAFMTMQTTSGIATMEGAVSNAWKICAHPVIQTDLVRAWPQANFIFNDADTEYFGLLDLYEKGACQAVALPWAADTIHNAKFRERLCKNDLRFTKSIIIELPIAFPLRLQLSNGFSSWALHAERAGGVSIEAMVDNYDFPKTPTTAGELETCEVEQIQLQVVKYGDEYDPIDIKQMALPFLVFLLCIFLATIFKLVRRQNSDRSSMRNLLGRASKRGTMRSMHSIAPPAQARNLAGENETQLVTVHQKDMQDGRQSPIRNMRRRSSSLAQSNVPLNQEETVTFETRKGAPEASDLEMMNAHRGNVAEENDKICMSMDLCEPRFGCQNQDRTISSLIYQDDEIIVPADITAEGLQLVHFALKMRQNASHIQASTPSCQD